MKTILSRLAGPAAALALGLLLTELMLRLLGVAYPRFDRPAPVLGEYGNPGAEGWYTSEGRSWVRINSDGLRDREHAVAKPPDTLRVAVLGDSFAAAYEVPMETAFWSVLERELASCPAVGERSVEVMNFGKRGFGTAEELLTLREKVWKYEPDVVLLAFLAGNDVRNNSRALQGGHRPYFYHDEDGRLVLDTRYAERDSHRRGVGPLGDLYFGFLSRSRVVQLFVHLQRRLTRGSRGDDAPHVLDGGEPGLSDSIYLPPPDAEWEAAWSVTEDLLRLMDAEVRAGGARFFLVTLSSSVQVDPDPSRRARYREAVGSEDLFLPDRRIEALARTEGFPHLILAPPLRAFAEAQGACLHGFENSPPCRGHWNELGHQHAGRLMATGLCEELGQGRR